MNELALFAGAGGGILGGQLLGWRTVCAVEIEPYPASVLLARQNDGLLPPFPVWDDIRTFDGRPWAGIVDVVSGGFPCQDISAAGKGAGLDGERSGLWVEMARIIGEVRPAFVYVENSPMLTARGLGRVLGDLASMGFDAVWGVLGADDVGAPHIRKRIWILAYTKGYRFKSCWWTSNAQIQRENGSKNAHYRSSEVPNTSQQYGTGQERQTHEPSRICSTISDTNSIRFYRRTKESRRKEGKAVERFDRTEPNFCTDTSINGLQESEQEELPGKRWRLEGRATAKLCGWATEPDVGRVAHGIPARVDRLKALGNGQVPQCAAEAWRILIKQLEDKRHE